MFRMSSFGLRGGCARGFAGAGPAGTADFQVQRAHGAGLRDGVDASGRLVPDLEQADFTVLDNGKPADVSLFSNESQPFTAVVMLDTSASMTANLKLLNRAAEQFLLRLLPVDARRSARSTTRSS